jgi:hypothetical protein
MTTYTLARLEPVRLRLIPVERHDNLTAQQVQQVRQQ